MICETDCDKCIKKDVCIYKDELKRSMSNAESLIKCSFAKIAAQCKFYDSGYVDYKSYR